MFHHISTDKIINKKQFQMKKAISSLFTYIFSFLKSKEPPKNEEAVAEPQNNTTGKDNLSPSLRLLADKINDDGDFMKIREEKQNPKALSPPTGKDKLDPLVKGMNAAKNEATKVEAPNLPTGKDSLSPSLKYLADAIESDSEFMRIRIEIESMTSIDEITAALQQHMSKKKAQQIALKLYQQSGKETIVLQPIDNFQSNLRKLDVPQKQICQIRYLIENGKKLAVRRKLFELVGSVKGQILFNEVQKFIVEKISRPLCGSQFVKKKNGLDQYLYNDNLLESDKANAKTMIVFGETGCGKSTFLNAIVNYIAGVEIEDTFRYIVIVENDSSQLKSITSTINDYYIRNTRTGQVYRLIDTPGFGDTEGIQTDKKLVKMIADKFKKDIEVIHSVLFVMKASTTRVTSYQQYVFQSVMDIFDKQIAPNFVFIFTFSDSGKPQVLPAVMDRKYGFGNYWNKIIEPKYIEVNNCGFFEKIDQNDNIKTSYWKIGMKCMDKLFGKIDSIQPRSLTLSKQMIRNKESLNIQIINTTNIIQQAISKRQNIKKHIHAIAFHSDEINNNKNFTYQVPEDQWYAQPTDNNVTRCNTARCFAEKNCHINCAYGDGKEKIKCVAMDQQGKCKICGCHYSVHTNSKIIRKVRKVMKKHINSENKRKYDLSNKEMKTSEAALKDLFDLLEAEMMNVVNATKQMAILQQQLVKVQMSSRKPQTTRAYLEHLIQHEKRMTAPGYTDRIEGYNEAIKEIELHEKIIKGDGNKDVQKIINDIKSEKAQKIIDSVKPGLFQQLKIFA